MAANTTVNSLNNIVLEYLQKKGYTQTETALRNEVEEWTAPKEYTQDHTTGPSLVVTPTISRDGTAGLRVERDGNLIAVFRRQDPLLEEKKDEPGSVSQERSAAASNSAPMQGAPPPSNLSNAQNHIPPLQFDAEMQGQQATKHQLKAERNQTEVVPRSSLQADEGDDNNEGGLVDNVKESKESDERPSLPYVPSVESIAASDNSSGSVRPHICPRGFMASSAVAEKDSVSLEAALSQAGQAMLGMNLYGSTRAASFFRSLLATIQGQQEEISYLESIKTPSRRSLSQDSVGTKPSQQAKEVIPNRKDPPLFQLIHAVTCSATTGHTALYYDAPTSRSLRSWFSGEVGFHRSMAAGNCPIGRSLKLYLEATPSLQAVALWITTCPEQLELSSNQVGREPSDPSGHPPQMKTWLCLLAVSPAMKTWLTEDAKFALSDASSWPFLKNLDAPDGIGVLEQDYFYFHHREALQRRAVAPLDQSPDDCCSVLHDALQLVGPVWDERCDIAQNLHSQGFVTDSTIARLFHPNMTVIAHPLQSKGEPAVCIVMWISTKSAGELVLSTWTWDFDGHTFYRRETSLTLKMPGHRTVQIKDLDAYPISYASPDVIESLNNRARKCWSLRRQSFVAYTGWDANDDYLHNETRFIVDVGTHRRLHKHTTPTLQLSENQRMHGIPHSISVDDAMPEGIALLALPAIIAGYNLQDKKWRLLRVKNIKDVHFNKSAFESLMVSRDIKDLVRALVVTQDGIKTSSDVIAGKGNGLILLLHGGPGTGKTLTAESVAEIAEKPLYRVTCGDIGTDPNSVENYLNTVLYLGKTWNCVILFDEADVFLEERDLFDLARNSLVSVFLRTLEYYEGILILTSNRVGTFDEAFKSRIQVAIHYPDLTRATRKKIWQNFLDILEEDESLNVDVVDIAEHIDELKDSEMNGRQIRNAISTARRVALFKKQRLAWAHISQVVDVAGQFTKYLEKVHRHKDDERARDMGLRA